MEKMFINVFNLKSSMSSDVFITKLNLLNSNEPRISSLREQVLTMQKNYAELERKYNQLKSGEKPIMQDNKHLITNSAEPSENVESKNIYMCIKGMEEAYYLSY